MFQFLGNCVNRYWAAILVGWVLLAIGLKFVAPTWDQVALDGDFDYLPSNSTSRRGLDLLQEAFPDEKAKSKIVLIFGREEAPLTKTDRDFAITTAKKLSQLQTIDADGESHDLPWADRENRVWTELTAVVGEMLKNNGRTNKTKAPEVNADGTRGSPKPMDGHAVMVVGRITTDMMATENVSLLRAVSALVEEARTDKKKPEGLQIGLSGSAMIGGDMQASIKESLKSTETTTVILVLCCLLAIYRAPLLVIIPMATIGISLSVATDVVALLALHFGPDAYAWSDFKIFTTTKIFVIVILFGAGTDFCLFLISRFKEELGLGTKIEEASGKALFHVGDALAASAFTTILGLATMIFAQYGKFSYAGPVVAICLFIALIACITFAPALLRAFGKVVFWPFGIEASQDQAIGDENFDAELKRISPLWDRIARGVMAHPGLILWVALGASAWFMFEGLSVQVTHDFMNELASDRASKQGTETIREYFAPGETAPMTVVATLPNGKLDESDGFYTIAYLHGFLREIDGVVDVRSLYKPAGGDKVSSLGDLVVAGSPLAVSTFVSETGNHRGEVTQLQLVLDRDPFSREARRIVDGLEEKLSAVTSGEASQEKPPSGLSKSEQADWVAVHEGLSAWKGATFEYIGTTPAMRDLERVTTSDQTTIQICVVIAVLVVIILILKRPLVCLCLIATVLLSYFATIGASEMFFSWYYGDSFDGLDWKAPIFLFVILIAVGQDYNIYLATRVFEEQKKFGLHRGLRKAMVQTGGIITSCGVIMAGTFISMASGSLRGMIELGFALALGVLLDTFFVRTVVVPCLFALMAGKEPKADEPTEGKTSSGETLVGATTPMGGSPPSAVKTAS